MRIRPSRLTTFAAPLPVAAFLATAAPAMAQDTTDFQDPRLQIPIPTIKFTDITISEDGTTLTIPFLANYINGLYTYAIGIATVVAAVMAVVGGFEYLTAGGDAGKVKHARGRITDAIAGVILTLTAYALLNTINPMYVNQKGLEIKVVKGTQILTLAGLADDVGDVAKIAGTSGAGGTTYCNSVEDCRKKCLSGESPDSFGDNPSASDMEKILDTKGVVGGGRLASEAVIEGLKKAGEIADSKGYYITVKSSYRPFAAQLKAICDAIKKNDTSTLGSSIAWPGGSTHGTGNAIDIELVEKATGKVVVGSRSCARQSASGANALATPTMSKLFDEIMTQAGAVRYSNEIWHYEFGDGGKACRCKFPNCPAPPMSCKNNC